MKRGPKPRLITKELMEQVDQLALRGLSQKKAFDALEFSETWWHAKKAEFSELGEYYQKRADQRNCRGFECNLSAGALGINRSSLLLAQEQRSWQMVRSEVRQCLSDKFVKNVRQPAVQRDRVRSINGCIA